MMSRKNTQNHDIIVYSNEAERASLDSYKEFK